MDLFESRSKAGAPLAERLRPERSEHFFGQAAALKILGPFFGRPDKMPNVILWGPPGTGKTTLARLIAKGGGMAFSNVNAIETGAKELRALGEAAHLRRIQGLGRTVLFVDEIHRLNRAQQDVLLPFAEAGDFTLIGATTENPGYELNSALLSRARVIVLERLGAEALGAILARGGAELGLELERAFDGEARAYLVETADGDARRLLSALELLASHVGAGASPGRDAPLDAAAVAEILQRPAPRYDKSGDQHHDAISAFIKSVRGSDPDAAVYYLARMLAGGEDPVFVARRLVVLASEDVGNADPRALPLAVAGLQAVELVGLPEAAINLAQVTTYLSAAPKSNASYVAWGRARDEVAKTGSLPVPKGLRSAKTKMAKAMGYGEGYAYAHDGDKGWAPMEFLPEALAGKKFYEPVGRGFEKTILEFLKWVKSGPRD